MPITRTFTVAELEAIGVPFECGGGPGLAEDLDNKQVESRRWYEIRRLIFRAPDDGKTYAIRYCVGLTEEQEIEPFEHLSGDTVTATVMEERQVTVTRWEPVEVAA